MITLTPSDWEEIYYALEAKTKSPTVGDDREWHGQLTNIMATIGPDGENAAGLGVVANP